MNVARLCSDLIQIRSENPPGDTAEIIEYIHGYLNSLGIQGTVVSSPGGRNNLIVTSRENRLLLCGHVDVVPAMEEGWSHHPFLGEISQGYVWGRGSSDMKGGCAAILHAVKDSIDAGGDPRVNLAFVCDEETGGDAGISHLLDRGLLPPSDCLIAEPSPELHPVIGQKGLCRLDIEFRGEPGHGSLYPRVGVSAVMEAFSLLAYLNELHAREFRADGEIADLIERSSPVLEKVFGMKGLPEILRRITYNPGMIRGGEKANIVAQRCTLELDLRLPWGCTVERILADIAKHAPRASSVQIANSSDPNLIPADSPIVRTTCAEIERVFGSPAFPIVQWAASDAKFLRKAGFPALEYGPGEITTLHAVDERVSVRQLEMVAEVYRGIISSYSSKKSI
jgi:succinyl-diaminopimelate desuccinylase